MKVFFGFLKQYWKVVLVMMGIVGVLAYITYSFVSPNGRFGDAHNDLKMIEPESHASYTDLLGNIVSIRDFKGKPLIVNSWASWMPFSQSELVLLGDILKAYNGKISVLAINRMEQKGTIQGYLATYAIPSEIQILIDPTDHFYKTIGGYAMPETIFYNKEGEITFHKRGVLTEDELRTHVEALIAP